VQFSFTRVKEILESSYPDMSEFTFITASARAKEYLQNFVHRELGGILPKFRSFDEYKRAWLTEKIKRVPLSRDEEIIKFYLFFAEHGEKDGRFSEEAAFSALKALNHISEFGIDQEYLKSIKGFNDKHLEKIDELYDLKERFEAALSREGFFVPSMRDSDCVEIEPSEGEYFVNLPMQTVHNYSILKNVPKENIITDIPLYGEKLFETSIQYQTSINIFKKLEIALTPLSYNVPEFIELKGRNTISQYLLGEISKFIENRTKDEQLFILVPDESLSFYLWETVFRKLGSFGNFTIGLPLSISAPGKKLAEILKKSEQAGEIPDLKHIRRGFARELYENSDNYVQEDQFALEAVIHFTAVLEKQSELMGEKFFNLADLMLSRKQFFIKGERSAAVQVVGLTEAAGVPFKKGIVIPLNSDVLPAKLMNSSFLNPVYTPEVRNISFEFEDVSMRQFMAAGEEVSLVSLYDEARNMVPSFLFNFLKNEFETEAVSLQASVTAPIVKGGVPEIINSAEIVNGIREFEFSFSSLSSLFSCPYKFYYEYLERIDTPNVLEEEENINQLLGTFIHNFFSELSKEREPRDSWEGLFEKLWKNDSSIGGIDGSETFALFMKSYIENILSYEKESGRYLLFGKNIVLSEEKLTANFGSNIRFKLKGFIDRVVDEGESFRIVDFKYRKEYLLSKKPLITQLEEDGKDFSPAFQLIIYAYLLDESRKAGNADISASFFFVKEEDASKRVMDLKRDEIDSARESLSKIALKIEDVMSEDALRPNYKSGKCQFCSLMALCRRENYYRGR